MKVIGVLRHFEQCLSSVGGVEEARVQCLSSVGGVEEARVPGESQPPTCHIKLNRLHLK